MKTKTGKNRPSPAKVKICVVDDHPIVREGLAGLIHNEPDLTVSSTARDAPEALKQILSSKPDLAIVDIALGGTNGIELIKDIKVHLPDLPVLVLSMHDESIYAERALRAGALGYIMKQEATTKLIAAIRAVLDGKLYVSEKMAARMLHKFVAGAQQPHESPVDSLSDRELEVFQLIGRGLTTRQIAQKLHLSIKTIDSYRGHIKEKLGLANATELMQYAIRWQNAETGA